MSMEKPAVFVGRTASIQSAQCARVFISHDSRDETIAEAFEEMLIDCSGGTVECFRSSGRANSSGIPFGDNWYEWIMGKINQSTDVVAILTAQSIDRPWILYEVGVAKGKTDTTVHGVAVGVGLNALSGPFHHWQNCGCDEGSLTALVLQLLKRNPAAHPREQTVRTHVQSFIEFASTLTKQDESDTGDTNDVVAARYFEEIKVMHREILARLHDPSHGYTNWKQDDPSVSEILLACGQLGKPYPDCKILLDFFSRNLTEGVLLTRLFSVLLPLVDQSRELNSKDWKPLQDILEYSVVTGPTWLTFMLLNMKSNLRLVDTNDDCA